MCQDGANPERMGGRTEQPIPMPRFSKAESVNRSSVTSAPSWRLWLVLRAWLAVCVVLPGLGLGTSFHSSAARANAVELGARATRAIPASPAEARPRLAPVPQAESDAEAEADANTAVDSDLVWPPDLHLQLAGSSAKLRAAEDASAWSSHATQSRIHNRGPPFA
jgi:hypothetical protein